MITDIVDTYSEAMKAAEGMVKSEDATETSYVDYLQAVYNFVMTEFGSELANLRHKPANAAPGLSPAMLKSLNDKGIAGPGANCANLFLPVFYHFPLEARKAGFGKKTFISDTGEIVSATTHAQKLADAATLTKFSRYAKVMLAAVDMGDKGLLVKPINATIKAYDKWCETNDNLWRAQASAQRGKRSQPASARNSNTGTTSLVATAASTLPPLPSQTDATATQVVSDSVLDELPANVPVDRASLGLPFEKAAEEMPVDVEAEHVAGNLLPEIEVATDEPATAPAEQPAKKTPADWSDWLTFSDVVKPISSDNIEKFHLNFKLNKAQRKAIFGDEYTGKAMFGCEIDQDGNVTLQAVGSPD